MVAHSAGLLLYRRGSSGLEVFLIHPGGPYWARKDEGAWSIPKGLVDPAEDQLGAAKREFKEETGFDIDGRFLELGTFRQPGGKRLSIWAIEGDCDPEHLVSNQFTMIWPPNPPRCAPFRKRTAADGLTSTKPPDAFSKANSQYWTGSLNWQDPNRAEPILPGRC
jgi:predicted NUDIX family NTP pyrophosphohydrolase